MYIEDILNRVRLEVWRIIARFAHPVTGIIQSYDPQTHAVKVQYQPSGNLSGWIPLGAAGVGNGWGVYVGPHIGQAVTIGFHYGDHEAPFIISRQVTESDPPVAVNEGEIAIKHESGTLISLLQDKSLTLQQAEGANLKLLDDGSITATDKAGTVIKSDGSGNVTVTA